jgi:hypothetical protein
MPSPAERLEQRKQLQECRVCAWLATLAEKDRKDWAQAIANPRYGATSIAAEVRIDILRDGYAGPEVGESSIDTHRRKAHR